MKKKIKEAFEEASDKERDFSELSEKTLAFIRSEINQASMCYALREPKWKDQEFVNYLTNWFK